MRIRGSWKSSLDFACHSAACAPPPVGSGGSDDGGDDYRGLHRPFDEGPRAFDLYENEMVPADVYDHPEWYTGYSGRERVETMTQLRAVRGKPDAMLTVYRAAPDVANPIRPGDWITLSKSYARNHQESQSRDDAPLKVHAMKVPAKHVRWAIDDLMEWGYYPD